MWKSLEEIHKYLEQIVSFLEDFSRSSGLIPGLSQAALAIKPLDL